MQSIYLVCGVPGSGKSWVCERLQHKYFYLRHDDYISGGYAEILIEAAYTSDKPILADCPFAERRLRDQLEMAGVRVIPVFVVEHPAIIQARYEAREGKPVSKSTMTRAFSISGRADEWNAFQGTSEEVLKHLENVHV